ncbi:MAG TPA: maleylpyruvate isomerase family mycothiol-dependent enzyme [Egibacteraceae bacterium]|nr:maleylpyruvate isomerase family mycothiol-dependent enzyme [Egibacteraceae bacterium]
MRKTAGLDAVAAQRARTVALAEGLTAEDWDLPCLPRWAVRDVFAHLVASDRASITGAIVRPLLGTSDRAVVERWNDQAVRRWRDRPPQDIVDGLRRWGARIERLGRLVPGPVARLPVGTPYGRHPVVFLLFLRVWDEWVHEQDVRWALGAPRDDVPSPPPLVIGQALADMTLAVLPRRRLPEVARRTGIARLVVDPAPPDGAVTARPVTWGVDFARRQYGPRVTAKADAEVRVHAAALALLLGGRMHWRALRAPWLSVDGDGELAAALLDAVPLPSSDPV